MEYFQSRLDSFFSPLKPKRTKASSSKQASPSRWPHPPTWKATPNSLAEAGFYYTPGPHDPDNVTCFMCKKSLGSWEPEDDPFEIHYAKCGNVCAWAALRCQKLQENGGYDPADPARHPTSKAMVKARLDTFGITKWPYDAIDGHGANSKALARAGFVWSAAEPGDDTVICLYCNLSLSGWDAEDDPYQEHLKRDKKNKTPCAFLKAYAESSLSKSTAKRPSSKATAKTSRSASQTIRTNHVETMDDSEDELAAAPSSGTAPSRASSARASKSRSSRASSAPVKTPASRRSTRGTSTGGKTPASRHAVSSELEDTDVGSESETGKRTSKSKRKAGTRSKARVSAIAEEEDEEAIRATQPEEDVDMQDPEDSQAGEQTAKGKRKRGRPKTATVSKTASSGKTKEATPEQTADEAGSGAEAAPPPATTKKTHARTRSKAALESDTDVAAPLSSKPTHTRTKSSSKTKVKQEEEVEVLPPAPAPKRKGKQKAAASPVVDDDRDSDAPPPAKSKSKNSAASRPKTKPEPEDEDHPSPDHAANVHQVHEDNPTPAPQVPRTASRRTPSLSDDAGYATAEPPADPDRMDVDGEGDTQPASGRAGPQAASQRTTSRSATRVVDDAQVKRPSPVLNGAAHESSAPSSRASSTRPLGKMSSQKSAVNDLLKVIEIDSDAEEEVGPKPRPTEKDAPVNGLKRPASKSGKKLQVEAVASLKTTHHSGEKDHVFLHNASPTSPTRFEHARSPEAAPAEVKSEPPGTPVSAVHRSAQVSPAHPQPVQSVDVQSDVDMPEQETSTPASPRTYHPVLAQVPIEKLNSLTEEEANMTLEQYIRREMELQYAQFKADAERRIEEFKQRAAEARKLIETS